MVRHAWLRRYAVKSSNVACYPVSRADLQHSRHASCPSHVHNREWLNNRLGRPQFSLSPTLFHGRLPKLNWKCVVRKQWRILYLTCLFWITANEQLYVCQSVLTIMNVISSVVHMMQSDCSLPTSAFRILRCVSWKALCVMDSIVSSSWIGFCFACLMRAAKEACNGTRLPKPCFPLLFMFRRTCEDCLPVQTKSCWQFFKTCPRWAKVLWYLQ